MRSLAWLLLIPLLSACCAAAPTDDAPKQMTGQAIGPAQVIGASFEAVQAGDRDASLAMGTSEWAAREAERRQGFTDAFFNEGEEPDNEGMLFALTDVDGSWKITSLR